MRKAKQIVRSAAVLCSGLATLGGCRGGGGSASYSTARIEPLPVPVVAVPQDAPETPVTVPPESGNYASVAEVPKSTMSHAQDYSWLEGTLEYAHADSRWKLRYAPIDADDTFGGSVILDSDVRLERFQEGEAVRVEGELVQKRSSAFVTGPLYRVHSIRPINATN